MVYPCLLITDSQEATLAQPELMDQQPELKWRMRPFLVDFIVEIHTQLQLRPEVLYLAINIVDRYVSRRVVYKKHYQLVGCAALWIAAKFEDSKERVPLVRELFEMCCGAYETSAFIQMEGHILTTIGYNANHPTAESWLRSYVQFKDSSFNEHPLVQSTSRFLMEITLFHREFVGVRPSVIAWGSLLLARFICGKLHAPAPDFMTRVNEAAAQRVAQAIDTILHEHSEDNYVVVSDIVMRKYSIAHFHRCSASVHDFYRSGRRYVVAPASTPAVTAPVPALAPSTPTAWHGVCSFNNASPSSASSDAGDDDEEPLTPQTPINRNSTGAHVNDFASTRENEENVGPLPQGSGVKGAIRPNNRVVNSNMGPPSYGQRSTHDAQALGIPPAKRALANRALRRLSN